MKNHMRLTTRMFARLLSFSLLLGAGVASGDILPEKISPDVGSDYYTRHNFMYERSKHNTTNYWRGQLMPVNTRVTLVKLSGDKMVLETEDGRRVTFANARKFTQRGIEDIASELLSPSSIPLNRMKEETRRNVLSGTMRLGMTKEEVLMTRGYPPKHETASIQSDRWVYWSSRFVKRTLVFEGGKLTRGRGLTY